MSWPLGIPEATMSWASSAAGTRRRCKALRGGFGLPSSRAEDQRGSGFGYGDHGIDTRTGFSRETGNRTYEHRTYALLIKKCSLTCLSKGVVFSTAGIVLIGRLGSYKPLSSVGPRCIGMARTR